MTTPTFTETLQAEVATLQAAHPLLKGALDRAFTLLVNGDLFPLEDGHTAHVRSQSAPDVSYVVNGSCDCLSAQYRKEPCVHRYAFRLYQKAVERLTVDPADERWEPIEAPTPPAPAVPALPEAPAPGRAGMRLETSVVIDGRQVKVALWGADDGDVQARLQAVLAQHPATQAPAQGQDGTPQCPTHGALRKGKRGWYCPHKLADDTWCKSKAK